MVGRTDGVTDNVYSNGLLHHSSDSVEQKLDELRSLMGKAEGDPLRIVGVGAGAWGSDRATAEHLFEVINSREDVLERILRIST
ncbi:hypothetical protein ACFX1X_010620 [Malus domestica]